MKAWLNSVRGKRGLALAGVIAALIGVVSWGQASPQEMEESGEVPMVAPPLSPQSPVPPNVPFTPPSPTPLPPEQAAPYVPGMPFAGAIALEPPVPQVRLRVQAPARIEQDKEIEYRLTVENVSAAPAHHVLVRDRLPRNVDENVRAEPNFNKKSQKAGDTDLLWELDTLKPGEQKVIVLTLKFKGNEDVENRAYVQFEHGQKVTTRIAKPSVSVKVTAPAQSVRYEAISFSIEVANTGDAPVRDLVVNDELPEGLTFVSGKPEPSTDKPLTWKIPDIPPHQTRRIEYQAIAQKTGRFQNNAKVTGSGASATGKASVTVGESKLKISISGPQRRLINRPIPYHITVGNVGTVPLSNVQVSDELPPGAVEFQSASLGGKREGGFVRWSLGNLQPGEVRSLILVLRSPVPGKCWVQAKVQADHDQADKALSGETHVDRAAGNPVIEIDKDKDQLVVGQKATYTIRLYNPGKNNLLRPSILVEVSDEISVRGQHGPTSGKQQGQQIRFDPLVALDAGQEAKYEIEVQAMKAGEAKLRAWWTDGRNLSSPPETWQDKTIVLDPSKLTNGEVPPTRDLQVRYFLGPLTRPRLLLWTWAAAPRTIP